MHGGEEIAADDAVCFRKTVHDFIRTVIKRRSEFESPEGAYSMLVLVVLSGAIAAGWLIL